LSENRQYQSNWIDDGDGPWDPLTDEIEDEMRDLVVKKISMILSGRSPDIDGFQIDGVQIDDGSLWI
jgi:hypothetical protein